MKGTARTTRGGIAFLLTFALAVTAMLAFSGNAMASTGVACAQTGMESVSTPRDHYQAGEVATINGAGYASACDVQVDVERPDGVVESFTATTDLGGSFTLDYQVPPPPGVLGQYRVVVRGLDGIELASTTFEDAPAPQFDVAPSHVKTTGARTFSLLVRNVAGGSGDVARCVRVETGSNFDLTAEPTFIVANPGTGTGQTGNWSLSWGTNFVQIRNNVGASPTSGRGLLGQNLSDPNWVRFEITVNVQATGTQLWRAWMNTSGTADCTSGSSDDLGVRAGGSFTRDYAMDFRDAAGNVIAPPSTTSGGTVDYRARITRVNSGDDLSYAAIAAPTCLSNISVVSVTDSGAPSFAAHVSDNFVRLVSSSSAPSFSGTKMAANGEWVQVHFTATAGCSSSQPFRSAAWKNTSPENAEGDIYKLVPSVSITDVKLTEGNSGTKTFAFTASLSHADDNNVTVNYATANGTAAAPLDYTAVPSTTLTFAPGETSKTVNVTVNGDVLIEPDETFFVNLSSPTNAFIADTQGVGTILNDDNTLTIDDVTLTEGNAGTKNFTFTVTLSPPQTSTVTVQYATANGSATAGSDYVAHPTTTLTFTAGQTSKTVSVVVNGDTTDEADETFFVNLFNSTNATISDSQGVGTILNDENEAPVAVDDSYSTDEDTPLIVPSPGVLGNDTDADGDTLTAVLVNDVDNGTLDLESDGSFTYTPNSNFNGSDSFTYRANDGTVNSNEATVAITVDAVNDAPTCEDVTLTTDEDTPGSTSPDCADVDGDSLTYEIVDQPAHGTAAVVDGQLTYNPDANYNGGDSFTYSASDGTANSNTANVSVTVNAVNDAPAVAADSASVTVDEGQQATNTGTWSDPDADQTITLTASVGNVTKNADGTWSWSYTTTDGPAETQVVTITADDGTTSTETTFQLNVDNVAPTATFTAPASVTEGSSIGLSLTSPSDPSSVDTDAGFEYRFSCDDGATWTAWSSSNTASCSTNDNGTRSVKGEIRDKDGGTSTYSASVTVDNVAPTATFNAPASVNEGSSINISLSSPSDPSSVDTAAGFEYRFSCDNGDTWSDWSSTASHACATTDNGTRQVKGEIRDKDGGVSTYGASVTVDNVAPSATFNASDSVNEGSDINLSLTDVVDPGTADTHEYRFKCGTGDWTAYGSSSSHSCPTSDNGTVVVQGQVRDDDGGESAEYSESVTVNNVAPSATFNAPESVDEGADINISLSDVVDPGSADTHEYRFSCDGGDTWTDWSASASDACATNDNGTVEVRGQVRDDDDGGTSDIYTDTVTVNNVAPTATFNAPDSVNEGTAIDISMTAPSDPSPVDTAAGFEYRFSCDNGDTWSDWGSTASHSCSTNDNGTRNVKGEIRDKDGGTNAYSDSVTVENVAPSASFNAPESVNEGSEINLSLTGVVDPGTADTHEYRFSCDGGTTWTGWSATASHSCSTNDNGTRSVKGQVRDDDGGESEIYSASVTVNNVAPSATFNAPESVDEGSDINLSLSNVADPGMADTHEYRFNCGTGEWTAYGTSASHSCATTDNGTVVVKGQVRDDDGGESPEYSASVTVNNVAPTATFNAPESVNEGSNINISLTDVVDPGSADTHEYRFSCDGGDTWTDWSASASHACATNDNGTVEVRGQVRDDDGGTSDIYSDTVTVNNVAPSATFNAPESVDEGSDINLSLTNVVDPATADTHEFRFSCDGGTTWTDWSATASHSCSTNDNGTRTVKGQVRDDDGGESAEYSASVSVDNVAPLATFNAPESVNEGSDINLSLTGVVDPGTADTHEYRFSCDGATTWTDWSSTASHNCSTNDNGTRSVKGQVRDDDGGESEIYSASVTVNNVAPTATFNAPESVNEGSNIDISLTSPSDPSSVDAAAGFEYRFSCDDGDTWTEWGASNEHSCPTTDNGTRNVDGEIRDKDGGVTTYGASVTVDNVAPSATFNAPESVNEGSDINLSLTDVVDPGSADAHEYRFSCDGGDTWTDWGNSTHACPTNDNGTVEVRGQVRDDDGGTSEIYSDSVTVHNVAPSATFNAPESVNEGSNIEISLSDVVDPGTADTHEYRFSCDGGTTWTDWSSTATHSCSTNDNGTRSIKGQVRDDDGGTSEEYSATVAVNNVAPTATFNAPESVNEGSSISLSLTNPSDPSSVDTAAGFEYRFSCDGGETWTPWSASNTHVCPTNDNGTKNVKGEIRDKDGGTSTYSDSVTVDNVAPTATFTAPPSVNEGSNIVLSLTGPNDPSSVDTAAGFTYAFDCGDGAGYGAYSSTNTRSCPTTDNGTRNVGGKIRDKDGGVTAYTATVTVNNVPPTLTSLTPSSYLVLKGSSVSVTGTYTDPGTGDTFTCIVNWDEPTGTPENVVGGPTSCTAGHTYTEQGTYTVSMKVRDDDGGESNTLTVIITVYDPSAGGFVTGGGWINSPAGSYAADPTASGRANFGFNSQYKKGASVPTGETEFQLHFTTFKFHSEAYEVLVVSGHKAQYRGTGKVNGVSGYRFVLTAYDGNITGGGGTDKFRIKISRIADGVVVYDTKMGVSEDMDLAEPLAIGGGQIVIHKAK